MFIRNLTRGPADVVSRINKLISAFNKGAVIESEHIIRERLPDGRVFLSVHPSILKAPRASSPPAPDFDFTLIRANYRLPLEAILRRDFINFLLPLQAGDADRITSSLAIANFLLPLGGVASDRGSVGEEQANFLLPLQAPASRLRRAAYLFPLQGLDATSLRTGVANNISPLQAIAARSMFAFAMPLQGAGSRPIITGFFQPLQATHARIKKAAILSPLQGLPL